MKRKLWYGVCFAGAAAVMALLIALLNRTITQEQEENIRVTTEYRDKSVADFRKGLDKIKKDEQQKFDDAADAAMGR